MKAALLPRPSPEGEPALLSVTVKAAILSPAPAFLSITVRAARAAGYVNAGTVEFIMDMGAGDPMQRPFYFMEMNTRLQVNEDEDNGAGDEGFVPMGSILEIMETGSCCRCSETSTAQHSTGVGGRGGVLPLTHLPLPPTDPPPSASH